MLNPTITASVTQTQSIRTSARLAYDAFLTRDGLYYWLCDNADTRPVVGGHLLLTWQTGEHVTGVYTALVPQQRLAFTWRDSRDPEPHESEVEITIEEAPSPAVGIRITLVHTRAQPASVERLQGFWQRALAVLAASLETGADLRLTERVIIGIFPAPLDEASAQKLGIPVTHGTRVTGLVEGFSAQQAGLQADDVIVAVNDRLVTDQQPLPAHMVNKKPGDTVQITYYRGSSQHTAAMMLRGYPVPAAPTSLTELAERVQIAQGTLIAELAAICRLASDTQASHKTAPDVWSAKEVIAHLILTERWLQHWMGGLLQGPEVTGFTGNVSPRLAALLAVHPTLAELVAEFERALAETTALIRAFPVDSTRHASDLWWMSFETDQMIEHARQHLRQIQAALAAAA